MTNGEDCRLVLGELITEVERARGSHAAARGGGGRGDKLCRTRRLGREEDLRKNGGRSRRSATAAANFRCCLDGPVARVGLNPGHDTPPTTLRYVLRNGSRSESGT